MSSSSSHISPTIVNLGSSLAPAVPVCEQTPPPRRMPSSFLTQSQRLWRRAYYELKQSKPEMLDLYESIFSRKLAERENSIQQANPSEICLPAKMENFANTELKLEYGHVKDNQIWEEFFQRNGGLNNGFRYLVYEIIYTLPHAALAWTGIFLASPVIGFFDIGLPSSYLIDFIIKVKWDYMLSSLLFMANTTYGRTLIESRVTLEVEIVKIYQSDLQNLIERVCSYEVRKTGHISGIHYPPLERDLYYYTNEKAQGVVEEIFHSIFEEGETPLHTAALSGEKGTVGMLLEAGVDVNTEWGRYGTALQAAAYSGNEEMVEMLIKEGADVNARLGEYGPALKIAAAGGNERMVTLLLEHNASALIERWPTGVGAAHPRHRGVAFSEAQSSLLHAAVASGNLKILKILLDNGAEALLERQNLANETPLLLAASSADLRIFKLLYSRMKDPDSALEKRDIDGRTPLHLAVERKNTELVQLLLDKGAKANSRDFSDTTPFQRASELENFQILRQLFPQVPEEQHSINASRWRSISRSSGATISLTKGDSATVEILSDPAFEQYLQGYSLDFSAVERIINWYFSTFTRSHERQKQLFLIANDSLLKNTSPFGLRSRWWRRAPPYIPPIPEFWTAKLDTIPSSVTLSHLKGYECCLECRLILPVFPSDDAQKIPSSLAATLKHLERQHSFVWIMRKSELSEANPDEAKLDEDKPDTRRRLLESRTFFSTLEHAVVPDTALDLCFPLIQQLKKEWDSVCGAAEERLHHMRAEVLSARGLEEGLIEVLLRDARLWSRLDRLLEDQVKALHDSLEVKNWDVLYEQENSEHIEKLIEEIDVLAKQLRQKLKNLTATSQELIQLEFNLTSIAEAQKSTAMNTSMKRLSWITFIFLPLMFIASLFGMNVDLVESNPSWWWYLPFAIGTTTLTFAVWIIFKRDENLENRIEGKFGWLIRKQSWDVEKGSKEETRNAQTKKAKTS